MAAMHNALRICHRMLAAFVGGRVGGLQKKKKKKKKI
jgi:hypothetical protein